MDSCEIIKPPQEILDYIKLNYEYDSATGKLWRLHVHTSSYREVKGTNSEGYGRVYLHTKEYRAHHICWYLHYGIWPSKEIDHKNRIRDQNNIDNLRESTDAQQTNNLSTQSKFGRCIWYKKRINRYEVCIRRNKQIIYVGVFKTPEEAIAARDNTEKELGYGSL